MKNYKVRFPNEIHATDYPLNWKEFEATNVLDKEVFGRYGSQMVAVRRKDYDIIGSAHNIQEIRTKEVQSVSKIVLSSLFKKNKNYLGINRFKLISNLTKKKVIALGGISKKNIYKLKLLNSSDFAGISYFE